MNTGRKGRVIPAVMALIICLEAAIIACGLLTNQGVDPNSQPDLQQPDSGESQASGDESIQAEGESLFDEQLENPVEPDFGSHILSCPPKGSTLYLGFDHALTINYEETSINHFLHQGWLQLQVIDDNGTIVSEGSPSIPYSMEGRMSEECTLTAEGSMMPSAQGTCEAGVVSLFIEENWTAMNGEMECVDSDGDVAIMPFDAPAMGLQQHYGQNGDGEIFYLVEGSEGYSTMRPFQEGEGYHTWTLYTEEVPLEPLVP